MTNFLGWLRRPTTTLALCLAIFTTDVPGQRSARSPQHAGPTLIERNIRAELGFLASDAMQGRGSGTSYERIAAEYIGSLFQQFGLEPAGDELPRAKRSFVQLVQLESGNTWNVIGVIRGSDRREQAILLTAHLDHLGVSKASSGDAIFNGADDDASGCVAVIEVARFLATGPRPKRTIYFVCFGSEELGGLGSSYFLSHSPIPLERIIANINFEMIGRADPKVGKGRVWLTGFERSNLGPELARHGARVVADPHPEQNFFERSDNYNLALQGVVAHTVSSFGLHRDYHAPSDEISKIDFPFLAQSISSLVSPIRWLANSRFKPSWRAGLAPKGQ